MEAGGGGGEAVHAARATQQRRHTRNTCTHRVQRARSLWHAGAATALRNEQTNKAPKLWAYPRRAEGRRACVHVHVSHNGGPCTVLHLSNRGRRMHACVHMARPWRLQKGRAGKYGHTCQRTRSAYIAPGPACPTQGAGGAQLPHSHCSVLPSSFLTVHRTAWFQPADGDDGIITPQRGTVPCQGRHSTPLCVHAGPQAAAAHQQRPPRARDRQ